MATLLELNTIEMNSMGSLTDPDPDVVADAQLRARLKMAMRVHARAILNGGTVDLGGGNMYPDPGQEANEAIAWSQQVTKSPEVAVKELLGLALAGAEALSLAQIRNRTDQQLKDGIIPLIPLLAKGLHPGR